MNKLLRSVLFSLIVLLISAGVMSSMSYATEGWCCKDGYVFKTTKDVCLEKEGHFFLTEKEAIKYCLYEDPGYCCYKGNVYTTTPEICKEKGGDYFATEAAAKAFCEEESGGWCCLNGMVFAATPDVCKKKGGMHFLIKADAIKYCEEGDTEEGWCCLDGTVFPATPDVCKKKGGIHFPNKIDALKYCDSGGKLPDLQVVNIFLNKKCQVVVKVRNNGPGMVPDSVWSVPTLKSSSVYIYIDGKKWGGGTIWGFDTAKALKAPGGTALYTSKYIVKIKAHVTATVDHTLQVAETDESNNKLTKAVYCKSKTLKARRIR